MAVKKKFKPKKKAVTRKKTPRVLRKTPLVLHEIKKIFLGIAILVSLCLTVAMVADIFFQPSGATGKKQPTKSIVKKAPAKPVKKNAGHDAQNGIVQKKIPAPSLKEKVKPLPEKKVAAKLPPKEKTIEYEVFKDVDHTVVEKPIKPPVKDKSPKIAIIIDDIGYDRRTAIALCQLHPDITFSVLPFSPFGRSLSERLHKKGAQLMLHLPMEPVEYPNVNPGPGAILSHMPPDLLLDELRNAIHEVPYIVGVNNHMGSRLTMEADKMNQIFTILKKKNLFFIDSRTASKSQCKASARLLKIPFAQRDVFLDNLQEDEYITGQFKELLRQARKHGSAIGIGHPYEATLKTLSREIPKLKNKIKIVRASQLVHIPG